MGTELLIASAVLGGMSAVSNLQQAGDQAKVMRNQANAAAAEKGKQVKQFAEQQKVSFLKSGVTLEGTPTDVLFGTFDTGFADIVAMQNDAQSKIKAFQSQANSKFISDIAGTAASYGMGRYAMGTDGFGFGSNTITAQYGSSPNIINMGG